MRRMMIDYMSGIAMLTGITVPVLYGVMTTTAAAQSPVPSNGIISQPGTYFLEQDLVVTRATGISINANNVTLDLRGHSLRYAGTPQAGTFGVSSTGRTNVRITNGAIGAFWFNVHASQNQGMQIDNVAFDDIPYIGVNAATSRDVRIHDNTFTNFRYDIAKTDPYVIGLNLGTEDGVITRNDFQAVYTGNDPHVMSVETVFVLFSANVSLRSVVTHNEMQANVPLNRSYGIWVASNAHVAAMHNTVQNVRYGITLASNATALAGYNSFSVDPPPAGLPALPSTFGVYAVAAEQLFETGNGFQGQTHPTFLPPNATGNWDNTNMVLPLEVNDLAASLLPGVGYDLVDFPGAFTHGGSVVIDAASFSPGPVAELKLVGWTSAVGSSANTAVSFVGGSALNYEFRADGLYLTDLPVSIIPEPTAITMFLTGLLLCGLRRSRHASLTHVR